MVASAVSTDPNLPVEGASEEFDDLIELLEQELELPETPARDEVDTSATLAAAAKPTPVRRHRFSTYQMLVIRWTLAAYLGTAIALHGTNIASTHDRVFDAHELVVDQATAISVALGLPALLAILGYRNPESRRDDEGDDGSG